MYSLYVSICHFNEKVNQYGLSLNGVRVGFGLEANMSSRLAVVISTVTAVIGVLSLHFQYT